MARALGSREREPGRNGDIVKVRVSPPDVGKRKRGAGRARDRKAVAAPLVGQWGAAGGGHAALRRRGRRHQLRRHHSAVRKAQGPRVRGHRPGHGCQRALGLHDRPGRVAMDGREEGQRLDHQYQLAQRHCNLLRRRYPVLSIQYHRVRYVYHQHGRCL